MKNKIKLLIDLMPKISSLDDQLFNILNEKFYDDKISPAIMAIEDLVFLSLFSKSYDEVNESFNTPGADDGTKPILWENGFPPEYIIGILKNPDLEYSAKLKKMLHVTKIINDGLKEKKKMDKNKLVNKTE